MASATPKELAARVAGLKGRRDYPGAHAAFQDWALQTVVTRTGWPMKQNGPDLILSQTVRTFAIISVTVHQLVTGHSELGAQQSEHIGEAVARLREAAAPLRILLVIDPGTKAAVLNKFEGRLDGMEVWTAEELTRLPLTLRN